MTDEGMNNLIAAILEKAVVDYKFLLTHVRRKEAPTVSLKELDRFFHSDWFSMMIGYKMTGDQVINLMKAQVKKEGG